jgi:hypothetical protein
MTLEARTWTDAATKRTLDGEFVAQDGSRITIKLKTGKTVRVALDRLIEADREFVKGQVAKGETEPAPGALSRLVPPVSLKAHPIQGEGKKRKAGLEVTNTSGKDISKIVMAMYFLKEDGSVDKEVPNTRSWSLGNRKGALGKGQSELIEVTSFFMEDDTASVDGIVSHVEWKDGTIWPDWTGSAPKKEGDAPVVTRMLGVLGEGNKAQPVVAVFNVSSKDIMNVTYGMVYLDAEGKAIGRSMYGYSGAEGWLPAGKGAGCSGCSNPPPKETVEIEVSLMQVIFEDESSWKPSK